MPIVVRIERAVLIFDERLRQRGEGPARAEPGEFVG
jgi:hypothetical protein